MVTISIAFAAVDSVGVPPANLTAVESDSEKDAVLEPVPSCVMISVIDCPVPKLPMANCVLTPSVTLWTGASAASTAMVELDVSACICSLYDSSVDSCMRSVLSAEKNEYVLPVGSFWLFCA